MCLFNPKHYGQVSSDVQYMYPYLYCLLFYTELDYIFGHYTGILLSSTLWFIIYCVVMKNKPQVYPKIIIPGLISGIMWGIAMGEIYTICVYSLY